MRGADAGMPRRKGRSDRRLTAGEAEAIRREYAADPALSYDALAARYGLRGSAIRAIVRGDTYRDAGGPRTRQSHRGPGVPVHPETRRAVSMTQARIIRACYAAGGITLAALGREYNLSVGAVYNIVHHVTYREDGR